EIRAGEAWRAARDDLEVDAGRERHLARVNLEDTDAAAEVGRRHDDAAIEPTRAQQRRIEDVGAGGRGGGDHAVVAPEAVPPDEQLIERLLALVVTAAEA